MSSSSPSGCSHPSTPSFGGGSTSGWPSSGTSFSAFSSDTSASRKRGSNHHRRGYKTLASTSHRMHHGKETERKRRERPRRRERERSSGSSFYSSPSYAPVTPWRSEPWSGERGWSNSDDSDSSSDSSTSGWWKDGKEKGKGESRRKRGRKKKGLRIGYGAYVSGKKKEEKEAERAWLEGDERPRANGANGVNVETIGGVIVDTARLQREELAPPVYRCEDDPNCLGEFVMKMTTKPGAERIPLALAFGHHRDRSEWCTSAPMCPDLSRPIALPFVQPTQRETHPSAAPRDLSEAIAMAMANGDATRTPTSEPGLAPMEVITIDRNALFAPARRPPVAPPSWASLPPSPVNGDVIVWHNNVLPAEARGSSRSGMW